MFTFQITRLLLLRVSEEISNLRVFLNRFSWEGADGPLLLRAKLVPLTSRQLCEEIDLMTAKLVFATHRKWRRAAVVFATLMLTGCGQWPPYGQYMTELVENRSDEFLGLESVFLDSGMTRACHGAGAGDIIGDYLGKEAVRIRSPEGRELRTRLEQTDMYCISLLENNAVGFEPYFERSLDGYEYNIRITHNGIRGFVKECSETEITHKKGYCVIALTDGWQVEYSWSPI